MRILRTTLALSLICTGCTHIQLAKNTMHQSGTWDDMQYKQVLDNVAAFVSNPESMPFYVGQGTGTNTVTDAAGTTNTITWNPFTFMTDGWALTGSRTDNQNWTLAPVYEADRLKAMQYAYKILVGQTSLMDTDQNCKTLFNRFHIRYYNSPSTYQVLDVKDIKELPTKGTNLAIVAKVNNNVIHFRIFDSYGNVVVDSNVNDLKLTMETSIQPLTAYALNNTPLSQKQIEIAVTHVASLRQYPITFGTTLGPALSQDEQPAVTLPFEGGWYHCGKKHDVPRDACYVGHHGCMYVWVTGDGVRGLTDATMAILKIAAVTPKQTPGAPKPITSAMYGALGVSLPGESGTEYKDLYNPIQSQIFSGRR